MDSFSKRFKFSDWPNPELPQVAAGVYSIWRDQDLIYCGMSGRDIDSSKTDLRSRAGLIKRLQNHANGRLSGNQFCVYVANRLVIPSITPEQLPLFASGELRLDHLTKDYIHKYLEYQYVIVGTGTEAFALEDDCRRGDVFGVKPLLNPANDKNQDPY